MTIGWSFPQHDDPTVLISIGQIYTLLVQPGVEPKGHFGEDL